MLKEQHHALFVQRREFGIPVDLPFHYLPYAANEFASSDRKTAKSQFAQSCFFLFFFVLFIMLQYHKNDLAISWL